MNEFRSLPFCNTDDLFALFKRVMKLNVLNDLKKIKIIAQQYNNVELLYYLSNYYPFNIQVFFIGSSSENKCLTNSDITLDATHFTFQTSNIYELKTVIEKLNKEYNSYGLTFPEIGFVLINRNRNEMFSFNYESFQDIINEL